MENYIYPALGIPRLSEKDFMKGTLVRIGTTATFTKRIKAGKVVGVKVFHTQVDKVNGQVENVYIQIKQQNSTLVSELQPVKNLRSYEGPYVHSFVPHNFDGGQEITVELFTDFPFSNEDVNFHVMFIYDVTNEAKYC